MWSDDTTTRGNDDICAKANGGNYFEVEHHVSNILYALSIVVKVTRMKTYE